MSEENKELDRRWFEEVWNQGSVASCEDLASPDLVVHDPPPGRRISRASNGPSPSTARATRTCISRLRTSLPRGTRSSAAGHSPVRTGVNGLVCPHWQADIHPRHEPPALAGRQDGRVVAGDGHAGMDAATRRSACPRAELRELPPAMDAATQRSQADTENPSQ